MEYKKEFRDIGFRVVFTQYAHQKGILTFSAQPYEHLTGDKWSKKPSINLPQHTQAIVIFKAKLPKLRVKKQEVL